MAVNRAVQLIKPQGEPLENLTLTIIPKPTVSEPKNVVVRVVLRPVNPADLLISRMGVWAKLDLKAVVVGSEGVGVVEEVGEGVTKVKVGQRVIPLVGHRYLYGGFGLWRDYVEVPETDCVPVPENISDEVAAQFFINPWTAYGLLKKLQIPKGEYLLQTAAGSAIGRYLISLAKHYGIKTINVVRRDEWIQPLTDLGGDYVINSSKEDVKAKVYEITGGKGAYGGVDSVATESTRVVASSLRNRGQVLVYGFLSGSDVRVDMVDLMREIKLSFFSPSFYDDDLPKREETATAILELISKKIIDPQVGKTYPLAEFKEAIKESEKEARGGRKVCLASY